MYINNVDPTFTTVFEELPIGCALDILRADLHQKKKVKCSNLNSRKSLLKKKLITKKSRLTKKGKELVI